LPLGVAASRNREKGRERVVGKAARVEYVSRNSQVHILPNSNKLLSTCVFSDYGAVHFGGDLGCEFLNLAAFKEYTEECALKQGWEVLGFGQTSSETAGNGLGD
jgi:hypothetical protein